jgi:hypothetical protein
MILVGRGSRHALAEIVEQNSRERRRQGIGNRLVKPEPVGEIREGDAERRPRRGDLVDFDHRTAA